MAIIQIKVVIMLELYNFTGKSRSYLIVLNQYFHSGLNRSGHSAQAVNTNVTVCMMKDVRVLQASVCVYLAGQVGLHSICKNSLQHAVIMFKAEAASG